MHIYLKNIPVKFHSDPIWNAFWRGRPNKNKCNYRKKKKTNKMSSSVTAWDLKLSRCDRWRSMRGGPPCTDDKLAIRRVVKMAVTTRRGGIKHLTILGRQNCSAPLAPITHATLLDVGLLDGLRPTWQPAIIYFVIYYMYRVVQKSDNPVIILR